MRVAGVTEWGGPEVLGIHEVDTPEPGPGQVRIRVAAAGVNPADLMFRQGLLAARLTGFSAPYVPGMDAAGTIDAVGPDVDDRLAVGAVVVALVQPSVTGGAYAEHIVLPAESVVPGPAGLSPAESAAFLMNAQTARMALDALGLAPGDTVAVTGAAGAVGGFAVQLAVADGLRVFADASEADEELVRSLGAQVVLPRGAGFAEAVLAAVAGGVDGLVDGANQRDQVLAAVRDGGQVASVKGWDEELPRGVRLHTIWVAAGALDTPSLARLSEQAGTGEITARVAEVLPLAEAAQAHRRLEAGGVRGRIVLDLS